MFVRKLILSSLIFTSFHTIAANPNTDYLNLHWIDKNQNISDNFFTYANGIWQKENPIPPEYASWNTFRILEEKTQNNLHDLFIQLSQDKQLKTGGIEQKIADFYLSGMDEPLINKVGITPLQPEFDKINAIKTTHDLQQVVTHFHSIGVDALFGFSNMQDFKNSQHMIGMAIQGGIGLPNRDYYLKDNKKFAEIRNIYLNHLKNMFQLLGDSSTEAAKGAHIVMSIETRLAKASLPQTTLRDPYAVYHLMNRKQLETFTPNFSWPAYFAGIGHPNLQTINLATPDFFKALNKELEKVSIEDWKWYLRWRLIDEFASYLSDPFVNVNFQMSSALTGTKKLLPRWKRVVATESHVLGFAVGELYVKKYFPPESKKQVVTILNNIRQALKHDLSTIPWMTPKTRQQALKKLDLMGQRVGYPEKWWDYSTLTIDRGPYVSNVMRANAFIIKRNLNKIGKPVDRTEWEMTPQTINAYYDPSMNHINLPAGILQPPFFDPNAPAALNYGAIGFIIGHEMTHGFDDMGALFDGYGNLKNWWSAQDLKQFKDATACIEKQFSHYKLDDMSVQGKLVLGEATADLGGLTLAHHALHASSEFKNAQTIQGLTPDQQFFLGAAHVWANNMRPEQARLLMTVDPHPLAMHRVNGTFANMPAFQAAFKIPPKAAMVNRKRCVIW